VFLVNSRHGHFTATPWGFVSKLLHPTGAHLLPKLRCQVAEFLNDGYLVRLRILTSPTCVGLRYGHVFGSLRSFSWRHGINQFMRLSLSSRPSELIVFRICLEHPPTDANRDVQHPDGLAFRVPPSLKRLSRGAGILTCFPSPTPYGLGLGTD
jgi:hypothetical protein